LLAQWDLWEQQIKAVEKRIFIRFEENEDAQLLATMFGVSRFIALAIACRIGPIDRFPRGRSLANFFGLTPGSRSSGETQRLGSITKEGSCVGPPILYNPFGWNQHRPSPPIRGSCVADSNC
jgi:transposase